VSAVDAPAVAVELRKSRVWSSRHTSYVPSAYIAA
jgi:hypothetical protein